MADDIAVSDPWGPYANYDDVSRLQYGRMLWSNQDMRARLTAHWENERHPYSERFRALRSVIEEALESEQRDEELDADLQKRGLSLRCVAREIPPVFGDFF